MERTEQLFLAKDIDNDHKVSTLLSVIGGETYTQLKDLLASENQSTKSEYQEIATNLQKHFSPKLLEIEERFGVFFVSICF